MIQIIIAWCYASADQLVRYSNFINCKVSTVTVLFGAYSVEVASDHISPGQKQASGPRSNLITLQSPVTQCDYLY